MPASPAPRKTKPPTSIVAITVTANVSNRSAAMPAQSPTLSPTLSAMTAGLRGSSSGIPASTLPTRGAATTAAFLKMPPPERCKDGDQRAAEGEADKGLEDLLLLVTHRVQRGVVARDAKEAEADD